MARRAQFRCLVVAVLVQLCPVRCSAASSTDTSLSTCDYASGNLYVVNSTATQFLFPSGYVECVNATGNDAGLCEACTCREKKVASVAGVTVAWVVCIGSGDATTCASNGVSGQEFCNSTTSSQDGSSSREGISVNVGDTSSSTSSEVGIIAGSDASAGVSSASANTIDKSSDSSASVDANVDVGSSSCSLDTNAASVGSSLDSDLSATATPSPTSVTSLTLSPDDSSSQAEKEDNVIGVVGTVEPSQTSAATPTDQNIIRPSDNDSAHQLDTSNGSSSNSSWSGKRLTAVLSIMCGIAAVAAIAVFVAVRKDQVRKKAPSTPAVDDYTDDNSSLATPMTHRLDGRYRHGNYSRRYGGNGMIDSSGNTRLASIVVIGPDDDFHAPTAYASAHQYGSYDGAGRKMSGEYARTESVKTGSAKRRLDGNPSSYAAAIPAGRQQFNVSHGPSVSGLPSPTHDPIFDTSNTQVSFSSSMSSEYDSPPDERVYESEESFADSFRMVSATYSDSERDSDASTIPRVRQTTSGTSEEGEGVSNTIVSFASSLSSLDSTEYDVRDTEASEYMNDSELGTSSSRVAISFDVGSISKES
ncbi:unnamed protein product [Phytophthora lilii]|uniref:Unnamed protein product n=1 Tax=Phytophthora lilii TaxID=2077276 RepID=A0A9W6WR02_9STRA|nr:unnamed protein product [Phytophthora lilii]